MRQWALISYHTVAWWSTIGAKPLSKKLRRNMYIYIYIYTFVYVCLYKWSNLICHWQLRINDYKLCICVSCQSNRKNPECQQHGNPNFVKIGVDVPRTVLNSRLRESRSKQSIQHLLSLAATQLTGFILLRPRQNKHKDTDDTRKCIFLNGNIWILVSVALKFLSWGLVDNTWRRTAWRCICTSLGPNEFN